LLLLLVLVLYDDDMPLIFVLVLLPFFYETLHDEASSFGSWLVDFDQLHEVTHWVVFEEQDDEQEKEQDDEQQEKE